MEDLQVVKEKMFLRSFGVFPLFIKRRCILLRCQAFSTSSSDTNFNKHVHSSKKELLWEEEVAARSEAYRQLENLNFKSATKILFTTPPKRKKFGLDFHLVQLFFACLPSLAVYLVAQYARSEIRRMEAVMK